MTQRRIESDFTPSAFNVELLRNLVDIVCYGHFCVSEESKETQKCFGMCNVQYPLDSLKH